MWGCRIINTTLYIYIYIYILKGREAVHVFLCVYIWVWVNSLVCVCVLFSFFFLSLSPSLSIYRLIYLFLLPLSFIHCSDNFYSLCLYLCLSFLFLFPLCFTPHSPFSSHRMTLTVSFSSLPTSLPLFLFLFLGGIMAKVLGCDFEIGESKIHKR